ncbi:MAG: hypothetical protein IJ654_08635 [Bacteroidales bacterium]|nr:hypothetical protein [Bacteroidales bacterium]
MKIEKNQVDKLNLELTVTVEAADYAPIKKKKLNERKRTAEFKGFRKGNVPMSLIEKVYGEQVLVDAVNDLVGGELYKFINESGIYTLGEPLNSEKQPEIEWVDGNDFVFIFDLATPEKVSFEVGKDDTVPHYSINITQEAKNEMKKNLSEYYAKRNEGKSEEEQVPVPTDEELDKEVAERLEFEYKQEADARLTRDIRNYFVEKAAIELPEDYLKRWLFQMNKGKYTMDQIEKEFPSFLEDFRWQLVRDFLMEKYGLQVTREDIEKAAEGYVAYQYAMYGIGNVPEEMIKDAASRILSEGKQNGMLQEQVENNKVMDALKEAITIKPKKIALSKFKELK